MNQVGRSGITANSTKKMACTEREIVQFFTEIVPYTVVRHRNLPTMWRATQISTLKLYSDSFNRVVST